MKRSENDNDEEFLLTFSDLKTLLKRNSGRIRKGALIAALLAFCYAVAKPIEFEAKATFKDKAKSHSGISESTTALLMISDSTENNAHTVLSSRKLKEELIKAEGLQGIIAKEEASFPLLPLQKIKNNLQAELAAVLKLNDTIFDVPSPDLKTVSVKYDGEVGMGLKIRTKNEMEYAIAAGNGEILGEGKFGEPFIAENVSFTLIRANPDSPAKANYTLTLLPLARTAEDLCKKFVVEKAKSDSSLVTISHQAPSRLQAARNVNKLMELYQNHIQCEHENLCEAQIDYLLKRQQEMGKQLENTLQVHADGLSSDLTSTGFANSDKAMEFLASSQQQLKQKLFITNLEIQRLENALKQEEIDADSFYPATMADMFAKHSSEKRLLKQQADGLDLALRSLPEMQQTFRNTFSDQLDQLEEIKEAVKETNILIANLVDGTMPDSSLQLTTNTKYNVKDWNDRLLAANKAAEQSPSNPAAQEALHHCKEGFLSYLQHLNHYLNVHQKNIQERLAHQQAPANEFQGINLSVGKELYLSYNKELSQTESQIGQQRFILEQINEPSFEASSLSTVLNDPVSNEIIGRISALAVALKDHDNRSTKEQERLQADLAIQKGFLATHVDQSTALLELRKQFIKDKIRQLQNINLSLIQEEISIIDNQAKEQIAAALENLKQEKLLLESNLAELRIEMAAFPQKWAAEQLLNQQMEISKSLMKEISTIAVSKNISNNLEKFQSAPIDSAYPATRPKRPHILLITLIGAFVGALFSFLWTLGRSIHQGVGASQEGLQSAGMHVSGKLARSYEEPLESRPPLDQDLNTLRRLAAFLDASKQKPPSLEASSGNSLLLLEGSGPDYALPLAELLSKKGDTSVIVDIGFQRPKRDAGNGMLQYLEGTSEQPAMARKGTIDWIPSGGVSRYSAELVSTERFTSLIERLKRAYDWVIVCSAAAPDGAEAETLLARFPLSAISLGDEAMQSLKGCFACARKEGKRVTFLLYDT